MSKHILIIPSWYVNSYNPINGIFFKEQAEALVKHGHKVGVIAIQGIDIIDIFKQKKLDFSKKVFIENGVITYSLQYPSIPKFFATKRKINIILFKKLFEEYIKEYGLPDVVHLHSFLNGQMALWIKEKYHIPYIVTEHFSGFARNSISKKNLLFAKKVFKNSNYNIAVSNEFKVLLENKLNISVHYLPNIVNIDYFNLKKKKEISTFNFINIAFLNKNKNQAMLIKSFTNAFRNLSNVRLTIVGSGTEYQNLKQLIKKLNMTKQITLYGRANRDEIKKLLQNSDAFVLSSKYETFGVVLIEAMACGLPVISTKCGGPESIINSDKIGLLTDINEIDLSNGLKQLYNNRKEYVPSFIRQYVENTFSEEYICKRLDEIYKEVLDEYYTMHK